MEPARHDEVAGERGVVKLRADVELVGVAEEEAGRVGREEVGIRIYEEAVGADEWGRGQDEAGTVYSSSRVGSGWTHGAKERKVTRGDEASETAKPPAWSSSLSPIWSTRLRMAHSPPFPIWCASIQAEREREERGVKGRGEAVGCVGCRFGNWFWDGL